MSVKLRVNLNVDKGLVYESFSCRYVEGLSKDFWTVVLLYLNCAITFFITDYLFYFILSIRLLDSSVGSEPIR